MIRKLDFDSLQEQSSSSSSRCPNERWGPPMQCLPETLSPGLKLPRREADHSLPTSAEIRNAWTYSSTSPYVLMALCLVEHLCDILVLVPVTIYVVSVFRED
jgi:hypothetical protein